MLAVTTDDLLARFDGVRGHDGQWTARCPAHDDSQASLTIGVGRDGAYLLTCWAGCDLDAIVHAVGMSVRDLFPDTSLSKPPERVSLAAAALPSEREITKYAERLQRSPDMLRVCWEARGWRAGTLAVLDVGMIGDRVSIPVRALDGTIANLLRYAPNGSKGPKMLAESGYPRLPLTLIADDTGPLWIVEGEADAISMAAIGLNVIGAPGASAKAHADWLEPARGRVVYVCMDVDHAGQLAAQRWARSAVNKGATSVHVVELDAPAGSGYDVGEFVREHRDEPAEARRLLLARAQATPVWEPVVLRAAPPLAEPLSDDEIAELKTGELVMRSVASVRSKRVVWLWRERIPRGRVGIVYGPPGQGKSTLLALMIAEITRAGGRVLVASAEDDIETTIRPRLLAHDAVLDRVTLLSTKATDGETLLQLPRDMDVLGKTMPHHDLALIDPLSAFQGDEVNSWRESSVRAMIFAPLMWHAKHSDCAVVTIMHINKSQGGDALSRISGSGGYGGAARFALLLGTHPSDAGRDDRRVVLVHVKASEGPLQHALTFKRSQAIVVDDDVELQLPRFDLVRDDERLSAEHVLLVSDPDETGAFEQAMEWLRHELADGPKASKRLLANARERGDFGERTLRRAKTALGIKSDKQQEGWLWVPPTTWR